MDTMRGFAIFVSVVLLSLGAAQGQDDQPPTDAAFAEQIQRLDPKNDKATRLKALSWINSNSGKKNAVLAVPTLERCISEDAEGEVRQQAVLDLCLIVKGLNKPCPLVVIEALHDKEDVVRWEAVACTPFFKTFAPGSVDVLLRGAKSENAELRSSSLFILARAAGKDQKALAAMERAKDDKVFDVRHSAHMALFIARDKLEEHLPYLIRVREDPASVLSPGPEDSEGGKQERAQRNLILLGTAVQMIGWSETRADELAAALMKLPEDKAPVMRRGAAGLIGASAVKVEFPPKRDDFPLAGLGGPAVPVGGWVEAILPFVDPEAAAKWKKDVRPEKSKVALRLEKLKVEAALRKLCDDDPDRSVRDAAGLALKRLASVTEKKP